VFTFATIILQAEERKKDRKKERRRKKKKIKIIIFKASVRKLSHSVFLLLVCEGLMSGTEK
jgi:hypothetical protein